MVLSPAGVTLLVLVGSLLVDRVIGDPHSRFHPVALLGMFIGLWGRPERWPVRAQRGIGLLLTLLTATLFALPFWLFSTYAPLLIYLVVGPFLLKSCFAWRSLEEHAVAVVTAVKSDLGSGRHEVQRLVSRNTAALDGEHILSAAYESVAENLVDSIIAPLLFFLVFGLAGAAVYRAVNTMDAMLGYRDERERLGWAPARLDDLLSYIPARVTGLLLLLIFTLQGRGRAAWQVFVRDRKKRPGFNGGIPMSLIAGGTGVLFEKPGVYRIGDAEGSLSKRGVLVIRAVREATLLLVILAGCTLFLLRGLSYR
jgi:adenosylcobinamide-phosphate synthase